MVSFKKTGDSHLLNGIELSDVAQPARQRAGAAPVQTETQAQSQTQDRVETPSITVNRGLSRKQKLGLGVAGVLGTAAVVSGFAWGGVETGKNQSLRGTNRLLNSQLAKQTAATQRLQALLASRTTGGSAAAIATAPVAAAPAAVPPAFSPPPPLPAQSIDALRTSLASDGKAYTSYETTELLSQWNGTDPAPDTTVTEEVMYGNLTYADPGVPVFGEDLGPSLQDISINMGNPATGALTPAGPNWISEYVGGAAAAIVAANPNFIRSRIFSSNDSDSVPTVTIPLSLLVSDNPNGFVTLQQPMSNRVLTDNSSYVRGIRPIRTATSETGAPAAIVPGASTWYPLLEKQVNRLQQITENYEFMLDVPSTMQALTAQLSESRDLTRRGDADIGWFTSDTSLNDTTSYGLLNAVPSTDFDTNIANLAANTGRRAATFQMRGSEGLAFFPNATRDANGFATSYADGLLIEPAMGGLHIHVKTDNGTVNEIFFLQRNYAFVDAGYDGFSGEMSQIALADPTGYTIDCDAYDTMVRTSALAGQAPINYGIYGADLSFVESAPRGGDALQPGVWNELPLKSGIISVPYGVFKQVAVWTDQVNVPFVEQQEDDQKAVDDNL